MEQKLIVTVNEFIEVLPKDKKIFLVHGKSFEKYQMKSIFNEYNCVEFVDFSPNPSYEEVCKAVDVFRDEDCDVIVAVGGGSAIDLAKCVKLFAKMDSNINYLEQKKTDSKIPLIAVPTTAGTGSEATKYAVIYYQGDKQSVTDDSIIPNVAVLLPELLSGLPLYQKKCTLLDALCQAIEAWWSVNSNAESIEYSKRAIALIKDNWQGYIYDNESIASEKILLAANLSGKAINITATTAPHAMSYKLTSTYNLAHGHAVALCMKAVWSYMLDNTDKCIDKRGESYLKTVFDDIEASIDYAYFLAMLQELEMDTVIKVKKAEEIDILAKSVNAHRLKNNPVLLEEQALKRMYERIVKESMHD